MFYNVGGCPGTHAPHAAQQQPLAAHTVVRPGRGGNCDGGGDDDSDIAMHGTCSGPMHFHMLQNVLIHAEKSWQPHTPLQSFCSLAQACPRPRSRACCTTLLLCFGRESPMHTWTVYGSPGWGKVPMCCSCAVLYAGPRCAAKHQRWQPCMQHNVCCDRPALYHIDPRT